MKLSKRLLAVLLLVCMVFSMLPAIALTASAATVTGSFVKCTSLSDVTTGDYIIVGAKTTSSFGRLTYGTLNSSRLAYTQEWTSAPAGPLSNPDVASVWHLEVSGTNVTIYNAENSKYLNTGFSLATSNPTTYTIAYTSNYFTLKNGSNYIGVNKSANYWRTYGSSTLTNNGNLLLFKKSTSKTLSSIAVSSNHRTFTVGGTFVKETVTATYSDSSTADVTNSATFSGYNMSSAGTQTVTASYTEGGVTKTATYQITVTAPTPYTLTYSVNGDTNAIPSVTNYVGTQITLPASVTVDGLDEDYSFAGWVTASTNGEDVTTATVLTGNYNIPASNTTLYAVFTRTEEGQGDSSDEFTKVTSAPSDWSGDYLIAYEHETGKAKVFNGTDAGSDYVTANVVNNKITLAEGMTPITIAAVSGGYSLMVNGGTNNGKYMSGTKDNNALNFGAASANTIAFSSSGVTITSNTSVLRFNTTAGSSNDRFRYYKSTSTSYPLVSLYKAGTGSSDVTYYNTDPEVIHKYTLTVDSNIANGSVTATAGEYEEGDTVNLSYAPTTGYQFDSYVLTKDADSSDVTATYISDNTLTMPAFDVTLSANFSLIPATYYSVTPSYNAAGGSISVNPSSAEEGTEITVTISPNTHWTLTSLTVNGAAVDLTGITNTYTFELAAPAEGKDVPVVAVFTEDAKYTVTIDPAVVTGGTLSADKTADIYAGETVTLTATPAAHYTFDGWQCTAGGATISGNSFTMPASNVTLSGSFTAEAHISVTFHAYSAESQPVTTAISDKYYNGDTVLAADVPAVEEPNGYVFMGWYGSTYAENASAPVYVTPAGTAIGSTALNFYAVYGKPSAGSSPYFQLSLDVTKDEVTTTYYVGGRTGSNKYFDRLTDAANAAQFGIDAGGYLYFMDGSTKTYISSVADGADISFATNISSATPWTVTENNGTVVFQTTHSISEKTNRYFSYNVQSPRFAAYNGAETSYPREFTKIGGPSYDSYTTDPARIAPTLTAENDTVIFDRDRAVTFNVLTNDDLDYLDATGVTVTVTGTLPAGVVNNNDGTFTFTPAANQQEVTFTYTITDKADSTATATATVTLKPAERVYYDETDAEMFSFVDGDENAWQTVSDPSLNTLDENIDLAAYEQENFLMYSGGTAKQVTVTKGDNPYVEFNFAGTGFEIIAAMTNTSGAAKIEVYQGNTKVKGAIVDTYRGYTYDEGNRVTKYTLRQVTRYKLVEDKYVAFTEGENITDYIYYRDPDTKEFVEGETWYAPGDASIAPANSADAFESYINANGTYVLIEQSSCWVQSDDDDANCYQIPILRMMGLDYGTYKVKVQPIYSAGFDRDNDGSYDFIFDGVNIYDPINDSNYKYISLNDIVSENGFGSVELIPCDHPTSGNWTFYSAASGNATGEALNRGSFVKRCTVCDEITDTAFFRITTSANPTTIATGGTSTLSYTPTSDNEDVQTILDGLTFSAVWTTDNIGVISCSNGVATGKGEGSTYAKLSLKVGNVQYASVIKSPDITVTEAPAGHTATFIVPEGATAPAAQTGNSVTMPKAVAAPADYDAHNYTFVGWVGTSVSDTTAAPEFYTPNFDLDLDEDMVFYALYTYGGTAGGYTLASAVPEVGDEIIIAFKNGDTYYALPNGNAASGTSIAAESLTVTNGEATATSDVTFELVDKDGFLGIKSTEDANYLGFNSDKISMNGWGDTKHAEITAASNGMFLISSAEDAPRGLSYSGTSFKVSNAGGSPVYIFSAAGATYYTTNLAATCKHTNTTTTTANATCTVAGSETVTCNDCGETISVTPLAALGHDYQVTSSDATGTNYTCSRCGDTIFEAAEFEVNYAMQPGVTVSGNSREGNAITLPTTASIPATYNAHDDYELVGWKTSTGSDTETNPSTYAKGATVTITEDTTFYPVYKFTETTGGGTQEAGYYLATSVPAVNDNFIIAFKNGDSYYALPNGNKSSGASIAGTALSVNNGKATATSAITFTLISNSGNYGVKSTEAANYLGFNSNKISMNGWGDTKYAAISAASDGMFTITSTNNSPRGLSYSGTNFTVSNSGASPVYIFTYTEGGTGGGTTTTTYTFELKAQGDNYTVTLNPATLTMLPNSTASVTATLYNNLVPETAESVVFSSSDDNIVVVDNNGGLLSGDDEGTATITVEMLAADGELYTATCAVTVKEQSDNPTVNYIGSASGNVYNWGTRGTTATFLTEMADNYYTGSYSYDTLSALSGDSGSGTDFYSSALGTAIHNMLTSKQKSTTSYDGTKTLYAYTDCIESGNKISSFYSADLIGPTWDSGSTWNREHTWPKSKSLSGTQGDQNDIMMLRPTSVNENGDRGNLAYGESGGYYDPNSEGQQLHGDVARLMLQHLMRWGNTSKFYGTGGVMESRAILLKWLAEDPVDTWELGRNDAVQRITGVRNVFVDYPELAFILLGAEVPANYSTPSKAGIVSESTYSATRPSGYEPVTEGSGSRSINATRSASAHRAAPTVGTITGGVVIDGKGNITTAEDFKEYGPDFGVYLAPRQALVFTLSGNQKPSELAIGAKALNGTPAKLDVLFVGNIVKSGLSKPIASAAEQYYDLDVSRLGWDGKSSDVIVLYNDGEGILDVTQLRYPTTDGTLTHNVSKMAAKNAAKMLQIVYGAPVTDPDPIEPTDIDLSFDSAALALQSDIGMIFYVDEAVMNSAEDVYASFTKALYNENGEITGYAEAEDCEAEFDEDLGKYFFRFEGINPAELGSAVTATLNGTRDGELVEGKTINYSVLTYINRMYTKSSDATFNTLLANLAAYGEAAQNYVSYNTANLVTANVADGLMAYATAEAPELSNVTAISGEGAVSFTGAYLSLREKVTVCYTIDASEYAGNVADLELRIYDGKNLLGKISGADFAAADGKYIASFSGLNALQMRTVLTAEVYDGDTCVSSTLDYSIESYCSSKAAGSDALAALVNALMNFGISAEAYFD